MIPSFEGQYRRVPKQNLAGASVHQTTDELLHKAHRDRMRREEDRKRLRCATLIKATIKSYIIRQQLKNEQRKLFDAITNTQPSEDELNQLVTKIVFFYNPNLDLNRLVFVSQKLLQKPELVILWSGNNYNRWNYKFKKLLFFHLNLLTICRGTLATHLRMIDVFTSETVVAKYIDKDQVNGYLSQLFSYLLRNKYFEKFRDLVEQRVPPMLEPSAHPPTAFAASLIDFIQRPLKLVFLDCDHNFNNLTLHSFVPTFLSQEFSEPIRNFVIPSLSEYPFFPYSQMINISLTDTTIQNDRNYGSWFLFSVVSLCKENYLQSCDVEQFRSYLNVLSKLSPNFSKAGVIKMEVDGLDTDSDSETDEPIQPTISTLEVEILEAAKKILNNYTNVQAIVSKCVAYQNASQGDEIIQSVANICYYLLSSKKSGLHEYKLLCSLVLCRQFLKKLWSIIITRRERTEFGTPRLYIDIISNGLELPAGDIQSIVPLLTTFFSLFLLLIATLYDNEFYSDENETMTTKASPMPFSTKEIASICERLRDLCVGLVTLAYPDTLFDFRNNLRHDIQSMRMDNTNNVQSMWPRLFKVAVALLRQLHSRDLRRPFCREGMWSSNRIERLKVDKPPIFPTFGNRRRCMRPFNRAPCFSRDDMEEGPPLSTRELRTMTVIREMPFLLSFEDRVVVFQNHILKDKLEHQGEAPYAVRGRSVEINVRRNYLYEDAFDKLSPTNAPDLRHVLRVQLRNVGGVNEAGVDGGGLTREFLSLLLKTAFDPNRGFFRLTNDNQLYPNPQVALLHPDFSKHYYFIGRMLGKAMYENLLVELPLAEFFLSKLVSRHSDVSIHHLASLDTIMYKNLLFLKSYEGDVSDLGLDFTVVIDELGETKVQELKLNGSEISVTNENKIEYIHLVADYKLNKQISAQNTAFKNGLADVIQPQWLHMFSNKELQILISGAEIAIDIADLKRNAKYSAGYHEDHNTIRLFWQVVENFNEDQRRLLLKFVTSCSRQPLFGFKELDPPFCIQKAGSTNRLPTASTCMNLLKMPEFEDYETLKSRLLYAIQAGAGFELS